MTFAKDMADTDGMPLCNYFSVLIVTVIDPILQKSDSLGRLLGPNNRQRTPAPMLHHLNLGQNQKIRFLTVQPALHPPLTLPDLQRRHPSLTLPNNH
jgi:hypothetical protein